MNDLEVQVEEKGLLLVPDGKHVLLCQPER
jgi:hypothetical protein